MTLTAEQITKLKQSRSGVQGAITRFLNEANNQPETVDLVTSRTNKLLLKVQDLDDKIAAGLFETDDTTAATFIEDAHVYILEIEIKLMKLAIKSPQSTCSGSQTVDETATYYNLTSQQPCQPSPSGTDHVNDTNELTEPLDSNPGSTLPTGPLNPAGFTPELGPLNHSPRFTPPTGTTAWVSTQPVSHLSNLGSLPSTDANPVLSGATSLSPPVTWHSAVYPVNTSFDGRLSWIDLLTIDSDASPCAIAKIYDPLGFQEPVVIRANLFLQKLWMHDVKWDDQIPENMSMEWQLLQSDLENSSTLRVPRKLVPPDTKSTAIHIFVDATMSAATFSQKINPSYSSLKLEWHL